MTDSHKTPTGSRGLECSKPDFLTTGQAARLCSVTPDTILKWIKKGRLNGVRTAGGHYRIKRRVLEPLITSAQVGMPETRQGTESHPGSSRCWEYLSDRGVVREECRQCVVYRVGAARCFLMAGLEADVGHARQFCERSCEECVYYRRVNGLAVNVLAISSDEALIDRLAGDEDERIRLRFAQNAYEASAIIHDFRPAFAVLDMEETPSAGTELLECLANDSRVPGLKVILVVPSGKSGRKRQWPKSDLIAGVLEKPVGSRQIGAVVGSPTDGFGGPPDGDP